MRQLVNRHPEQRLNQRLRLRMHKLAHDGAQLAQKAQRAVGEISQRSARRAIKSRGINAGQRRIRVIARKHGQHGFSRSTLDQGERDGG